MICLVINGTHELETDTPTKAAKAVKDRLSGMGNAIVKITVEPVVVEEVVEEKKGKGKKNAS